MNLVQIRISIRKVPTNFEIIHFMPGTNNLIYFAVHCLSKYSINKLRKPNGYYIFLSQITVVREPQIHNNIGLWQEPKVLTIIETYRVRNNKNVTLRYTTLVIANINAATCFGYAKRLSSGCMSENIKGKYIEHVYIVIELTVRTRPYRNYVWVLRQEHVTQDETYRPTGQANRPSGSVHVSKRLL